MRYSITTYPYYIDDITLINLEELDEHSLIHYIYMVEGHTFKKYVYTGDCSESSKEATEITKEEFEYIESNLGLIL